MEVSLAGDVSLNDVEARERARNAEHPVDADALGPPRRDHLGAQRIVAERRDTVAGNAQASQVDGGVERVVAESDPAGVAVVRDRRRPPAYPRRARRAALCRGARHAAGAMAKALLQRAHHNVAVVAFANKLARIAWAMLRRGERFAATGTPMAA